MTTWCEKCALDLPALSLLAGEFLHAQWPDEFADADDAVRAFALEHPDLALRLREEVDGLLTQGLSEELLADLLVGHLGLGYWPEGPYVTYEALLLRAVRTVSVTRAESV